MKIKYFFIATICFIGMTAQIFVKDFVLLHEAKSNQNVVVSVDCDCDKIPLSGNKNPEEDQDSLDVDDTEYEASDESFHDLESQDAMTEDDVEALEL